MKIGDLITSEIFSDMKGISDGYRLYLKKRYSRQLKSVEEWTEICEKENIIEKVN